MIVALVAVRFVKKPVTAVRRVEKKLVLVAFVVDEFVAANVVAVALPRVEVVNLPFVAKKLVEVAFVVDALVAAKLPVVVLFVVVRLAIVPVVE